MLKDKTTKSRKTLKKKALLIFIAVLLVLLIFAFFDGLMYSPKKVINAPVRNISHDEDPGAINDFNLVIDKLNINVPVIPNVDGTNKNIYTKALESGVAHYKNTALPHSGSNIVIFGHSSTVYGRGEYTDIFAKLDELEIEDEIKILFNHKEYIYLVNDKKIVADNDLSVIIPTEREVLTLLTCWPVGKADKRLVIVAKPLL